MDVTVNFLNMKNSSFDKLHFSLRNHYVYNEKNDYTKTNRSNRKNLNPTVSQSHPNTPQGGEIKWESAKKKGER